jgi:RimJ/RimL family protein N-acetyltransferase
MTTTSVTFDPLQLALPARWLTPRLILRCPTTDDIEEVNGAVAESLARLKPWMPWAQEAPTRERADSEFRAMQARFLRREDLAMFMFERAPGDAQGRFVGGCGLHRIQWGVRCFEIGYWRRSSAPAGLIDEAVQALTRIAFDDLGAQRVEVRMDAHNTASRRVAERNGYSFEGVLRSDSQTPQGAPRDTRIYSRVRGVEEP